MNEENHLYLQVKMKVLTWNIRGTNTKIPYAITMLKAKRDQTHIFLNGPPYSHQLWKSRVLWGHQLY